MLNPIRLEPPVPYAISNCMSPYGTTGHSQHWHGPDSIRGHSAVCIIQQLNRSIANSSNSPMSPQVSSFNKEELTY
uniref:Uncharacterized protein n=1 Tax=Anguilla anguilla TaxID=7936 RepID=A0A0E9P984_ANGAN